MADNETLQKPSIVIDSQPTRNSTNAVQSGGTYTELKKLENLKANKSLFTGEFSESATYDVDQLVTYGYNLYRCISRITAPEQWNPEHWILTNLNVEFSRLRDSGAGTSIIADVYGEKNQYIVGDYVIYNSNLYRCIEPVNDTFLWDSDKWESIKLTDEYSIFNRNIINISNMVGNLGLRYDEEDSLLYLTNFDDFISDPVRIVSGGGGGGSSSSYTVRLTDLMGNRNFSVIQGTDVMLSFEYTSVDGDNFDDGPGIGTITINGVKKRQISVQQGANILDITNLLSLGSNNVIIRVANSERLSKSIQYTITVAALSISSTFAPLASYRGDVTYSYTVIGTGDKTIHFIMDGIELDTATVTTSGRSQTYTIHVPTSTQESGGHVFECYATQIVGEVSVKSNVLRHGMLWINDESTVPVITSTFNKTTAVEGEMLTIPYIVYDPIQENTQVELTVLNSDESVYKTTTITVNRLSQIWYLDDYPAGNIQIQLSCGSSKLTFPITVSEYSLPVEPITDALVLEFSADGRSNGEENPAQWSYDNIEAVFSGFGWTGADGWVNDEQGAAVLRFLPGDTMTIPFQPFAADARETGYTIEVELATRDVRDYESVVLSCMNGGRGFQIASQEARLASEQSGISMLFKEDSRVRVSFSIENRNLNRLVYIYINGIMCGVTQYPTNDNFQQASPVGLTIGAETCGLDLYKIRCYTKGLTRFEQLDNFIIDRSSLAERIDAVERNNILNDSDEVAINKLPATLPYMILNCAQLPQYKGDKKPGVEVTFVDPLAPARNWTATGVEMDVQGTSSAGYPVKNYKIKLKSGITWTESGETESGFPIREGELPTKTICFKADFASSENANNVTLARFYNDVAPYQTAPQVEDNRVRQGIDGFGIALFWQDSTTDEVKFIGKGNCNIDKGNEDIFGFTEDYPNAQSWEFKNNTSNRVLFKSADFTGSDWKNDFEARYPEESEDISAFANLCAWVVSTDRDADTVTSASDKAARLQKFKDEFDQHFIKDAMLFYYLFTETFLMVDNRAKNMFMTTYDGTHWFSLPYDFDTAIGINNEGALVFEYNLEDTDKFNGADVFNGQESVLWKNVRDAFSSELAAMYKTLRSMNDGDVSHESPFSYYRVAKLFTEHQSVWPEAIWNEDAFIKYLQPYLLNNEDYLGMLQGNKASQRDWWLFNAFRYRDSKYKCGDAEAQSIKLRCYAVGNITITPYSHIYGRVKYGSYTITKRCTRNQSYVMECGLDQMNDTETYVYSADRIASVGDLSHLLIGQADFSAATKLQNIKLGDEDPTYENLNLGTGSNRLSVGSNDLLTSVNIANCKALGTGDQKSVDFSGCIGLKTLTAIGTQLKGVDLPNGGRLETLRLPATLTNFTIQNQKNLQNLYFEGLGNLETLFVENTPNIPVEDLILENPNLNRVRLIGIDWMADSAESLEETYEKLLACSGINADGSNAPKAIVQGIVRVNDTVSDDLLNNIINDFPDLLVSVNGISYCIVTFRNWNGDVLDKQRCTSGGSVLEPVAAGRISRPTRPTANHRMYTFRGWDKPLNNIQKSTIINAVFNEIAVLEVTFVNDDNTVLYVSGCVQGGGVADPVQSGAIPTPTKASTAQYTYTFNGWNKSFGTVMEDIIVTAEYTSTTRSYTYQFLNNDETVLKSGTVNYGTTVTAPSNPSHVPANEDMEFRGWLPESMVITGTTDFVAQYEDMSSPLKKYLAGTLVNYESDTASKIASYAFYNYTALETVRTSATVIESNAFYSCSNLTTVELISTSSITINANAFINCSKLAHFIINSSTVSILNNTNAFSGTKIKVGTGAIYVPTELVDSYKSATNWSAFASQIFPISVYPLTDFSTISDSWDTIIGNANYATDYKIGDIKLLDLGSKGQVYMELVAMDTDVKADSSGNARMTWLSKSIIETHNMNASSKTSGSDIGLAAGGWENTDMRAYLKSTIKPLIPEVVRHAIVEVTKISSVQTGGALVKDGQTTTDDVWIPSVHEIFNNTNYETTGAVYSTKFNSSANRIKYNASGSASGWWLRSASDGAYFRSVNGNGSDNNDYASNVRGLVLGFCI